MATSTFNPYPALVKQLSDGMDFIAKNLKPTSTVDDLANAIYDFIQPLYYPGKVSVQIEIEIKSVVYSIINSYNNNPQSAIFMYGPKQSYFIDLLLGLKTSSVTPINSIGDWLLDIEDNITKDNMTIAAQNSLLLATGQAKTIYEYWNNKVAKPEGWAQFFQKSEASNYANIPFWLVACTEGALIGAQATSKGLIAPTTDIVSVNIITSLMGALAIGSGKVIFKWVPRLQPSNVISNNTPIAGCGCGG